MKVNVGDVVESEFGKGPIVAITREYIIHEGDDGKEYAIDPELMLVWVPITGKEIGGGNGEMEVMEHPASNRQSNSRRVADFFKKCVQSS